MVRITLSEEDYKLIVKSLRYYSLTKEDEQNNLHKVHGLADRIQRRL